MDKITVLLVDDHKLIAEAWTMILNSDKQFWVIGRAVDADEALNLVKKMSPRIALVDINMSPVNGFEITRQIREVSTLTKVIAVSMHNNSGYVKKMMRSGASGYVTKNSSKEELMDAIVEVNKGNKYICQEIKDALTKEHFQDPNAEIRGTLSKRELEIAYAVGAGLTSREIALKVNISLKTVEVHRYNILKKLHLKNSVALINYIKEQGL
jgi:DNA-binding NarL/FixJ family response regulator